MILRLIILSHIKTYYDPQNSRTWYGKYLIHDTKSNLSMNYEIDTSFNSSIEKECQNFCGFGNHCIKEYYIPECTLESGDN